MKNIKDEFLQQYEHEILSLTTLPKQLMEQYSLEACLKHTKNKQLYLLCSRWSGEHYILKQRPRICEEGLQREYILLSRLDHPAIPQVVDYMEDGQNSYLLREYIPGSSLYELAGSGQVFAEEKTVQALLSICSTLDNLHHQHPPVIHGAIKPQNVVLTPAGKYVLINIGIGRHYQNNATEATAAPEQFLYGQNDERSDIYGLGMLAVFLLTGGFDVTGPALRKISTPLQRILFKCLSFNPDRRYANVGLLKSKLERCLKKHR